jgi:hypothetical protein
MRGFINAAAAPPIMLNRNSEENMMSCNERLGGSIETSSAGTAQDRWKKERLGNSHSLRHCRRVGFVFWTPTVVSF